MSSRLVITILIALALPMTAVADEPPFAFGPRSGANLAAGVTGGGSFGALGGGGFVGAEVDYVHIGTPLWTGAYLDSTYDFGSEIGIVTAGPSVGYSIVGVDGGAALSFSGQGADVGLQGRLLLTFGVVSLYGRVLYFLALDDPQSQVGLQIKLPLWASE